ncbi:MAG TPA: 5'-nucleotidase C-terminal domain-containing protein, partial [Anaerolineales bacterium]|nr:5'-nucleotidase C-terminal domain-containing protein [Anaerolineales bacterium]
LYNLLKGPEQYKELSVIQISDYHGQLVPLSELADTFGPVFTIGGSAFLKPWFDTYRAEARDGVLTIAAGDSVGATPPISNFFGDTPTIELMNLMEFSVDGIGNHNFDRGQTYLRETLIPLANFPYVTSNIVDPATGQTPAEWSPSVTFDFSGFKVGVIGFSNEDLETLIFPGNLDPFEVLDTTSTVNAQASLLRRQGYRMIIALGHEGATAGDFNNPTGPVIDLADSLVNVDAVFGDHTDFQTISTRPNGILVSEARSKGIRFNRVRLVFNTSSQSIIYKTGDWHKPWNIGVTPDAEIQAIIDELNAELAPIFNTTVGQSTVFVPRADACGQSAGRTCESLIGNTATDAMRTTYDTDFAITNSGGLRADLTCPTVDNPSDFCPPETAVPVQPFFITRGQVFTVLPFGNVVATLTIDGALLKTYLENGISTMPAVNGRYPQVSGLCFTYEVTAPIGSRVTAAVHQAEDGSCTGDPIDLTAGASYTLAINDFMASGGDGYPFVVPLITTQDFMDEVLSDFVAANTPISPNIGGRIVCTDADGPGTGNDCPIFLP